MAKVSDVVAAVRRTLQDYDSDRYSDPDIVARVNGARRALCEALPKTYSLTADLTLTAGHRQAVPADCHLLQDVEYNLDADGSVSTAVSIAEREYIDLLEPKWRMYTPGRTVHYMFDERKPLEFEVYPPAEDGAKVRISYVQRPADLALTADLSAAEAQLQDTLADYAIFRLLSEDAESPANAQRAVQHAQLFAAATGASLAQLLKNSPNTANVGGRLPKSATGQ